jgi:hypothetical protein
MLELPSTNQIDAAWRFWIDRALGVNPTRIFPQAQAKLEGSIRLPPLPDFPGIR